MEKNITQKEVHLVGSVRGIMNAAPERWFTWKYGSVEGRPCGPVEGRPLNHTSPMEGGLLEVAGKWKGGRWAVSLHS